MNDNINKVYEELKGGGADVGSPEEFKNWLSAKGAQGYENRLSVYNELKGGGADVGSYDDFRNWMGFKAVKSSKSAEQSTTSTKPTTAPSQKNPRERPSPKLRDRICLMVFLAWLRNREQGYSVPRTV